MTKEAFNKLSLKEKRIAVAKDVIRQIKKGKYEPLKGIYARFYDSEGWVCYTNQTNFQKSLKEANKCEVCAIGAAVTSLCRLNSNLVCEPESEFQPSDLREFLGKVFSKRTICLMENAFEKEYAFEISSASVNARFLARDFGDSFASDEDRLIGIMKNIIKNEGEFKV